jgi:hypothetical protein
MNNRYKCDADKFYKRKFNITDTSVGILNDEGEFIENPLVCVCESLHTAELIIEALTTLEGVKAALDSAYSEPKRGSYE